MYSAPNTNKKNILDEYKILSVLGFPIFAIKTEEELLDLQAICKIKLREVKNLTLIETPPFSKLEKKLEILDKKCIVVKKDAGKFLKKLITIRNSPIIILELMMIAVLIFQHYFIRIGIKKQMCEFDVDEFYTLAIELIEYRRDKNIRKLAGLLE